LPREDQCYEGRPVATVPGSDNNGEEKQAQGVAIGKEGIQRQTREDCKPYRKQGNTMAPEYLQR
jgi:hypothetical protein